MEDKTLMALRTGFKFGCWAWSVWKDGKQRIGIMQHPLEKFYKEIDAGEYDDKLKASWIAEGEKP